MERMLGISRREHDAVVGNSQPRNAGIIPREEMTRYVLGELSEEEQQRIEEIYFTDPAFLQDLLAARNELVDAYVEGNLNSAERGRFEDKLRLSPALVEKVEFTKALFQLLDSEPVRQRETDFPGKKQSTFIDRLTGLGSPFRLVLSSRWGLATAGL